MFACMYAKQTSYNFHNNLASQNCNKSRVHISAVFTYAKTDIFDSMFGVLRAIEILPTYYGGKGYVYHLYIINIDTTQRIVTL